MRLVLAFVAGTLVVGCGDEPDAAVARDGFVRVNDALHQLHLDVLELPAWPTADYEAACAGGGSILMRSNVNAQGAPAQLFHTFRACSVDGWTFDGQLDYLELVPCDNGLHSYAMQGQLEISGVGDCAIDAMQTCGLDSGVGCGVSL